MTVIDTRTRRFLHKILSYAALPAGRLHQTLNLKDLTGSDDFGTGIVFIVGAPRTGTTLFYQILTNMLNVGYLSNLSNLFYHSLLSGMMLHERIFGARPHNNFSSDNGRTKGWNSVNESGKFWYQWYPKDICCLTDEMLSKIDFSPMVNTIRNIQYSLKKPLVFKNQTNSQRVSSLARLFPDSIFVHVVRAPLPTVKSIIRQRRRFLGSVDKWYSIKPDNYEQIKGLDYVEQVVQQIYGVDRMIQGALDDLDEERWIRVRYEDLCKFWQDSVHKVKNRLELFSPVHERQGARTPKIKTHGIADDDGAEVRAIAKKVMQIYG
ncbi:MAG: sulfotransferase family protein [Elusimicrobiota bacterium]